MQDSFGPYCYSWTFPVLINTCHSTITWPDAEISGFSYFSKFPWMSKPVVAIPRLQTDVDLNPRLLNVNLVWRKECYYWQQWSCTAISDGGRFYSGLGAFPHCSSQAGIFWFWGFEPAKSLAMTRNMVKSHVPSAPMLSSVKSWKNHFLLLAFTLWEFLLTVNQNKFGLTYKSDNKIALFFFLHLT